MDDLYQSACRSTIAEFSQDIVLSNAPDKSGNVRPTPLGIAKSEDVYALKGNTLASFQKLSL